MTAVVDASVALRWLFPLDASDRAVALLAAEDAVIAPDLVIAEIVNAAWKFVSFDGVPAAAAEAAIALAPKQFDELASSASLAEHVFKIALELRHPAYDCFYVALAERRGCKMVTSDQRLLRRCRDTRFASFVQAL